jgi:hypothetical protein
MRSVVVAYAEADARAAERVARALAASGYLVEKAAASMSKPLAASLAGKDVVVLWSRHAAGAPALRRSALEAQSAGTLSLARVDGYPPPPSLRAARPVSLFRPQGVRLSRRAGAPQQGEQIMSGTAQPRPAPRPAAPAPSPGPAPVNERPAFSESKAEEALDAQDKLASRLAIGALVFMFAFAAYGAFF